MKNKYLDKIDDKYGCISDAGIKEIGRLSMIYTRYINRYIDKIAIHHNTVNPKELLRIVRNRFYKKYANKDNRRIVHQIQYLDIFWDFYK